MPSYLTVAEPASDEFIEKKSRFIGQIAPAASEEEALCFLAQVRARHREARHHVFAYCLRDGQFCRQSDDGEPQGTGGVPVLHILQSEGLVDVVVAVTRYFGGVLLGVGGLTRAYSQGARLAVRAARLRVMALCLECRLTMDYSTYGRVNHLLSREGVLVLESAFGAEVALTIRLKQEDFPAFSRELRELTAAAVEPEILREAWAELETRPARA